MYIRKTERHYKGKTYTNHLLVESVVTPKGPRQRTICSLGSLEPAPRQDWLRIARKLEASLRGQLALEKEAPAAEVESRPRRSSLLLVDSDGVETKDHREAGPVHVGHQMWRQLGLDEILGQAGFNRRACLLTEAMTLNRLIFPLSERAMPDWIRRTALGEILGADFSELEEDSLYRHLDRLHPNRERIERELAESEKTLFGLEETIYLYDLTSTYFEGQAERNGQAKRGYSRDHRPDCKQVLVGLILDGDGFPKAHEIFDGNRQDRSTVEEMLGVLEKRTGRKPGTMVVVDRGMAYREDLEQIQAHGMYYLVAGRQAERNAWLAEFENEEGWQDVIRPSSDWNPYQEKTRVRVKSVEKEGEVWVLCLSDGRREKDRAIREKQEVRLIGDLEKLRERVGKGRVTKAGKIHEAIGRLKERYPRVARYYEIDYEVKGKKVFWREDAAKKVVAEKLDGSYVLRTDRQDLTAEKLWRTYMMLTRVESAFRSMKSPLLERPIFHQLESRTQTHIFLCVLAYHILAAIEKRFVDRDLHTSWWTLREQLSTHQVSTIVLPLSDGRVLNIRQGGSPEPIHKKIYEILRIPPMVMKPIRTWQETTKNSD